MSPSWEYHIYTKILSSVIIAIILILVAYLLKGMVSRYIKEPVRRRSTTRKLYLFFFIVGAILIGSVWAEFIGNLSTIIGLIGAGVAIALKDIFTGIFGWMYLIFVKPFSLGDRIELDGIKGDVVDISIFQVSVLEIGNWTGGDQSTGRVVFLPTSVILTKKAINYTKAFPFIWDEISFLITFESNWRQAAKILEDILNEHQEKITAEAKRAFHSAEQILGAKYGVLTPAVYFKVTDSGVQLWGRFLVEARKRRTVESELSDRILEAFGREEDISFAYTTYRIVNGEKG